MILLAVVASMLSGPFMVLVAVLSALMLGLYFIEEIIGHDIQGVSSFDNGAQALLALGALIVSGAVLWAVHFGSDDDLIMDKGADIIAGIHSLIKSAADSYGVFFKRSPSGRGFSGIHKPDIRRSKGFYIFSNMGGNPGKPLEKIQSRALSL
jgi:hypothetical protein